MIYLYLLLLFYKSKSVIILAVLKATKSFLRAAQQVHFESERNTIFLVAKYSIAYLK